MFTNGVLQNTDLLKDRNYCRRDGFKSDSVYPNDNTTQLNSIDCGSSKISKHLFHQKKLKLLILLNKFIYKPKKKQKKELKYVAPQCWNKQQK